MQMLPVGCKMYLINYKIKNWKNALYNILLLFLLNEFLVVADVLSLVKHQFQCVNSVGYELCSFPEQYCHEGRYNSECRPCSKSICDKFNDADFPLQCRYNCSIGIEKKVDDTFLVFITEHAIWWFCGLITVSFFNILICAVIPLWRLWLKKRLKRRKVLSKTRDEEEALVEKENDDSRPKGDKNPEDSEPTDSVKDESAYCEQRLKNVNPTDSDDVEDTKNRVVTTRDRLSDDVEDTKNRVVTARDRLSDDVEDTKNRVVTARDRLSDENTRAKLQHADTVSLRHNV